MRNLVMWLWLSSSLVASVGCHDDDEPADRAPAPVAKATPRRVLQVPPPADLKAPPDDATKTASGLIYKRLVTNPAGAQIPVGGQALLRYTGWRQRTGETFFTTTGADHLMTIDPAHAAPAFREALPLLHKGEKMMLWLAAAPGTAEPVAYEVEFVDVVAKPTATAVKPPAALRMPHPNG